MADERPPDDPGGLGDRPQDRYVSENLPSPSEQLPKTLRLSGLLGDSDRAGYRRLYFNKQLDYYAEFRAADVRSVETVPSDQPPFIGLEATKVTLRRDATVSFTQVKSAAPVDEFDLDVRLRPRRGVARAIWQEAQTWEAECPGPTWGDCPTDFACGTDFDCPTGWTVCKPRTCNCTVNTCFTCGVTCDCEAATVAQATCRTCGQATCQTCRTACGVTCPCETATVAQATCRTCGQATCQTCGQATCQTCAGQATCATCVTCEGRTCETCDTCNPHVFTCGPHPQCA